MIQRIVSVAVLLVVLWVALCEANNAAIDLTNDRFFKDVTENKDRPAVVLFHGLFSSKCRHVYRPYREVANHFQEQDKGLGVTFGKVNVEEFPAIARGFGVENVPTIIMFSHRSQEQGGPEWYKGDFLDTDALEEWVQARLTKHKKMKANGEL